MVSSRVKMRLFCKQKRARRRTGKDKKRVKVEISLREIARSCLLKLLLLFLKWTKNAKLEAVWLRTEKNINVVFAKGMFGMIYLFCHSYDLGSFSKGWLKLKIKKLLRFNGFQDVQSAWHQFWVSREVGHSLSLSESWLQWLKCCYWGALGPFLAGHIYIYSGLREDFLWGIGKLTRQHVLVIPPTRWPSWESWNCVQRNVLSVDH